ncbi:UNVERIFIED_CONTAM: protein PLANT CADMIUM RESISTANCE 10 [Sesamum latifolium]|uniref:Protein PLANT CADMIUM RESISTANCE 10 n=1 Tax=Sesamum latifolium TaxID=2727402 RepID=A0AAW2XHJ9_9LAMI
MVGESTYVPPPYVPLRQSDAEADLVSPTELIPAAQHIKNGPEQWSSGICACFDDMQSCCIGLVCPCYLFGKNAEVLGSGTLMGSCMMHFILWALVNTFCCMLPEGFVLGIPGCFVACYACGYRKILRSKYNLEIDRTRKSSSGSCDSDPLNELGQAIDLNEVSCLFESEIVTFYTVAPGKHHAEISSHISSAIYAPYAKNTEKSVIGRKNQVHLTGIWPK